MYDKGAIKGMHKIGTSRNSFATHQPDRQGHVNHVSKNESSSFKQLLLPQIAPRQLDDLETAENPFKVIKQSE